EPVHDVQFPGIPFVPARQRGGGPAVLVRGSTGGTVEVEAPMFTWICPKCGREVPPAYNDCPDCAAKAKPPAAPEHSATAAFEASPVSPPVNQPAPSPPPFSPAQPVYAPPQE